MEEVVHNRLTMEGIREVKLISDSPVSEGRMMRFVPEPAIGLVTVRCYDTTALNLFYGEASWPAREAVDFQCDGWPKFRRVVVWKLVPGERVSVGVRSAASRYFELFMRWPRFAFIRHKPAEVENGIEIENVMLMEANWALRGCLMVGG